MVQEGPQEIEPGTKKTHRGHSYKQPLVHDYLIMAKFAHTVDGTWNLLRPLEPEPGT